MPLVDLATGATLHYEDTKPDSLDMPVIVIHGLLGTARKDMGDVIDWLDREGFRVLGLTLRGYGESTPKPRDFPVDFYDRDAEDLIAFMDALNLHQVHVIGYSDGGEVSLIAIGKYPKRFASCIVIGAVGNFGADLRPVFQRSYPGTWITEEEKTLHGIDNADVFILGWVRSTIRMVDGGGDVSLKYAKNITCPLIIMLGKDDKLNPRENGERFTEQVINGRVEMFDCGHPVHQQQTEAFQKITLEHLRKIQNR